MQKNILVLLGVLTVFFVAGCGGSTLKTYPVTGKVTYNGVPVDDASISFYPKVAGQGDAAYAGTDSEGVYKLQTQLGKAEGGTTPGEYIVMVSKVQLAPGSDTQAPPVSVLPAKYGDSTKTPLSFTVEKKKNTFDIELKDE